MTDNNTENNTTQDAESGTSVTPKRNFAKALLIGLLVGVFFMVTAKFVSTVLS